VNRIIKDINEDLVSGTLDLHHHYGQIINKKQPP